MSEHYIQLSRSIPFIAKNGFGRSAKLHINAKRHEDGNWFVMMICDFLKSEDYYNVPDHDVMEKINTIHDDAVKQIGELYNA